MDGTAAFETKTASGTEETPEISGNLLFVTVPDEEGYSAGMRHAVPFLNDLKDSFDLDNTALIDLEPASMENGAKTIYTGSVGKTMPAVLVQGSKGPCIKLFPGCQLCRSFKQLFHENRTGTGICRKKCYGNLPTANLVLSS